MSTYYDRFVQIGLPLVHAESVPRHAAFRGLGICFVGKGVAKALGYDQADIAVLRNVDEDDRTKHTVIDRKGRTQKAYVINRSYKNQSMRFGMWLE